MITVFLPHLVVSLASLLQPEASAADTKIPDGYYGSAVFVLATFMRVSGDTAFVDFVAWDKYPREVKVDTLYYNQKREVWTGTYTELITKREKHYLRHNVQAPSPLLGEKTDLRMKPEERFYGRKVDPRNTAMLHAYYLEFLKKHHTPDERLLYYHELYRMVDTRADHGVFRNQFEMYRPTLEAKIVAIND
jgi:hypothetical protein